MSQFANDGRLTARIAAQAENDSPTLKATRLPTLTLDMAGAVEGLAANSSLPHYFDNTLSQFARVDVDDKDLGWMGSISGGSFWLRVKDGTNTKDLQVINGAGGDPTADAYDSGGGVGLNVGLFQNCFTLNADAAALETIPHFGQLAFAYDQVSGLAGLSAGTHFFLESSVKRHDLIDVYPLHSVYVSGSVETGDTLVVMGVTFTAVAAAPNPAAQEFIDVVDSTGTEAACAASIAATINDPASQALLLAATPAGVTVAANVSGDEVVLDSGGGINYTLTQGGGNFTLNAWGDLSTALACVPGADLS